jgi:hypothetical protein
MVSLRDQARAGGETAGICNDTMVSWCHSPGRRGVHDTELPSATLFLPRVAIIVGVQVIGEAMPIPAQVAEQVGRSR